MAITTELLQGNTATAGLTAEQMAAIVELSQNDETAVIAKKTGEIYGGLDADILAVSGIEKNGTEKTYDYAKRVIGEIKTKADGIDGLNTQIATLTKEKARLEKVIADGGGDAETKKQLTQAKADLANITKQYAELQTKYDNAQSEHDKAVFNMRLDSEIEKSIGGLKFKATLPESVTAVLLANAKDKVKGMNPQYVDDGNGGKILAFMGADGAVMRNPENNLKPYTAGDLLIKELAGMDVLEKGKKTSGAGSGIEPGGASGTIDLSGAKTRVEANDIITKALLAQGLTRGSAAFSDAMDKAWIDGNVASLPEK